MQIDHNYFVFPVTVLTTVLKMLGGLISSFKMFDSVANGKLEQNKNNENRNHKIIFKNVLLEEHYFFNGNKFGKITFKVDPTTFSKSDQKVFF